MRYDFNINLFDNGSIWINMQPSNAQSCSYSGQCQEVPKVIVKEKSKGKKKKRSFKNFKSGMYVGGGIGI